MEQAPHISYELVNSLEKITRTSLRLFASRPDRERARTTETDQSKPCGYHQRQSLVWQKAGPALAEAALRVEKRWEPATPKAPAAI